MKGVAFVDQIVFSFAGNHFSHAVTLGDVDGDGTAELVVGNVAGSLHIFKGSKSQKAWRTCSGLGMITSVTCGDVTNSKKNVVLCANAKGECFVIDVAEQVAAGDERSSEEVVELKAFHHQELALNVHTMLVCELVEGGGSLLAVGQTDRIFRVYQWQKGSDGKGALVELFKERLDGQIGCLSTTNFSRGTKSLLIAQPGGTFIPVAVKRELKTKRSATEKTSIEEALEKDSLEGAVANLKLEQEGISPSPGGLTFEVLPLIGRPLRHCPTSSTEVIGGLNIRQDGYEGRDVVAVATLDGTVRLFCDGVVSWELTVNHNLFSVGKLPFKCTGDDDVIVVCAWDGTTYIIDHKKNLARHHFHEDVCAFALGHYGLSDGSNATCFVYTTFSRRISLYYNVELSSMSETNALEVLETEEFATDPVVIKHFSGLSREEKRALIHKTLYHYTPKNDESD